jgi:hypothetical protein
MKVFKLKFASPQAWEENRSKRENKAISQRNQKTSKRLTKKNAKSLSQNKMNI